MPKAICRNPTLSTDRDQMIPKSLKPTIAKTGTPRNHKATYRMTELLCLGKGNGWLQATLDPNTRRV